MATTEVDTAETVPLTPLQKIEVDDKEFLIAEYEESSNQLSKDELNKIEIEINKALVVTEKIGDGDIYTAPVHNDAEITSFDAGAKDNVGVSVGPVLEKVPTDLEVAEERNSTEGHVHTVSEENDELRENEKLDEPQESSSPETEFEKIEEKEKHVPSVDNVAKVEAEVPAGSQWDEKSPGEAGKTPSENVELLDHLSELESHKEGKTQPGANKISNDNVKAISSTPVKQIEDDTVVADAKEEHEKQLDSEVREKIISENRPEASKEIESIPNALYEENLEVAERSEEMQEKKEESISGDPSTPQKDNDDSKTDKSLEVIADEFENKESTTDTDALHEEGIEKEVPEIITQPVESLHVLTKELETAEKETDSIHVEEHEPEQAISSKDDPEAEKLESSLDIIPDKTEDEEPSESALKIIPDVAEEKKSNEQHTKEANTESKEHESTKETLDSKGTENKDIEIPTKEGSSSLVEETQSVESKKMDDNDVSVLKTEEEKDGVSQTEITEEKAAGPHDVEVETGNLPHVVPQQTDTDLVKHAATEIADALHVTEKSAEVEGLTSKADSIEADSPPVSSFNSEANKEKSKEEPSPTLHVEEILHDEDKSEKREEITEEVNDGHISTSIEDSITEQTNIVGQDENIFTESHDEDVTAFPLDDQTVASKKNKISEQVISETDKEPEKIVSQTTKPEVELPESSIHSSTQKPEEVAASGDIAGIKIATTEALADKNDEQGTYIAEYKANDIELESAREMNSALTETKENTGEAETDILNHKADVKEILSTDHIPAETKDVVSEDAGLSILLEKDDVSATSKTAYSTPEEIIEEKETGELPPEKLVEPEKPHNIESWQISKDEDADTKEGESKEISVKEVADITSLTVTGDDSSFELPLPEESNQKETSKDEEDDEKPAAIDETTETVEPLQVVTPAEINEDTLLNEPEGNEPYATGLNNNDAIECEKAPQDVQEVQTVERQPEDDDKVMESKIAEEAVEQKDKQSEEIIHLNKESDDTEIPPDNFTELKDEEEKPNRLEEENKQDQAKENDIVHEIESASEVIIHEDQQKVQLKHLHREEEEDTPSTKHEEVVQENLALKIEYLPSDSVEAEPIGEDETVAVLKTEEEPEGILHDEKKVNAKELKQEDNQGQLGHVSDGTENLDPHVSYTSEEKQTSLESNEVLDKDLKENSKNDHTEVDVQEKEIVNNELVLQEPSDLLGNDDEITTLKSEENPEDIQEEKKIKQAEDVGDTELSESVNVAALIPDKENELVNTEIEADSSEDTSASINVKEPAEKAEYISERNKVDPTSESDIQDTSEELPVGSQGDTVIDVLDAAEVVAENIGDNSSDKIVEESFDEDATKPDEVSVSISGVQPHRTQEVEQVEETCSLVENKIETSLEVVSEPGPDQSNNPENVSKTGRHDSEKLKQISEPVPDGFENLENVSQGDLSEIENLEQVSDRSPDDKGNLEQVSEQAPDDQKILKQADPAHLKQTSEPNPDDSEKLTQSSEPDPDDTETLKLSEPEQNLKSARESEPNDSENQETAEKQDIPEDCDDLPITEHPKNATVEVLEKTYEQAGETAVSDEASSVSVVEETALNSIEESVHEEDSNYQIPELKAGEISELTQRIPEPTIESAREHVEKSDSEETVGGIQHNGIEEEKKTTEASEEHIIKELEGAEGFTPPVHIFVKDNKSDEVEEEINEEEGIANAASDKNESKIPATVVEGDRTLVPEVKDQPGEYEADKGVILQENEPGLLPKEAEEHDGPSASSLNDNGTTNLESEEAPEDILQQDKDGQEEANIIVEKITVSEVLVQPHDNPGEGPEQFPGDPELSTSIVNDEKITNLTNEEKEEKQDGIISEVVTQDKKDNDQPKSDDVEEKPIAIEDAKTQPDKILNGSEGYEQSPSSSNDEDAKILEDSRDPEEVEEKLSVDNQPEDDDTVTDIKTAEDAVVQQDEQNEEIIHLPNETEEPVHDEHISYQIPEKGSQEISEPSENTQEPVTETEKEQPEEKVSVPQPNDAKEENQSTEASEKDIITEEEEGAEGHSSPADAIVDERKPGEAYKEEANENVAADTNKVEPEIPFLMVEGNQILVQEVKEGHEEGEILKEQEVKESILQENEPEVVPVYFHEPSASSANDVGITHLGSKDVPEEVLQEENDKDGLEDPGSVTEKMSLSKGLGESHENPVEQTEHMPRKTEETELDTSTVNNENTTSLKILEDEERTQDEVKPEVVTEDRKEKDEQNTDDIADKKQATDEVTLPVKEQVQFDQFLNEPEGNEPYATGLNNNNAIECEKGPQNVQEVQTVERQTEDDDKVMKSKIAEEAVEQKDKQSEEIIHLNKEADDTEIPSDNFTELKEEEEEKPNRLEEEKKQDQVKENDTVDEIESASEVIIHEDQQKVQLKHLHSEEEEATPSTIHKQVVPENQALNIEYLPSDSEDETVAVLKTEEEPEGILHDEKKINQVNFETEEKKNAKELEQEDDQGQVGHVSDGTENLDPHVSYTSEEKQTSQESKEVLDKDLKENSKNDHTEVDVQEKEIVNNELMLQEPSASLGNEDVITTLKSEENPEEIQKEKEIKQAEDVGDAELSESVNVAALIPDKETELANTKVEADSSVENAPADEAVPRGWENPGRVEEDEQQKDQLIDEKVTSTEKSVKVDSKGDLNEDAEPYASNAVDDNFTTVNCGENTDAEETQKHTQESGDDTRQNDTSNEDVKSPCEELNVCSIETKNNLETKEPENVEDDAKENSTIEDSIYLGNLENKVETSYLETELVKSVDEKAAPTDETTIINELHESNVEKEVDEVLKVSAVLPPADENFGHALESIQSVEVTDSVDFVETAKETEEEKLESIIPVAGKEDEKDLINMETHQEKLPHVLGEENQYANDFGTIITNEKTLPTLKTFEVPTLAVEDDQANAPEIPGKHEAETLSDKEQNKLTSSKTFNDETTEKIPENKTYVEANTSSGSNTEEPDEISSSVLDKGDEIQKEYEGDENIQTIKEKASLVVEDVTIETSEAPVTIKAPDQSTIEPEATKKSSVNENHEPLSSGNPKPEDLGVREVATIKEVQQMQEASSATTQLKDNLHKQEGEAIYIEVTHKEEPEDGNDTEGRNDSSNEIVTELVKLQEPDAIVAPVGDERTRKVTSIDLVKEETKGETETRVEPLSSILDECANEVPVQEKLTVSPADSHEVAKVMKVSPEFPQVFTRDVSTGEGKQINEAHAGDLPENKVETTNKTEAMKVEREIKDEPSQDLNLKETKLYTLGELELDESSTKNAAFKVNLIDRDSTELTAMPSEQVEPSGIPLKTPIENILERQVGEEATEKKKPAESKSIEDVIVSKDPIAISEKKDDTKPSSEIENPSTTRELVTPQNKISTIKTEGNDTSLPIQHLIQSKTEAGLRESTHADKSLKDGATPVSTENNDVQTEIQQSTARSLDLEVVQPKSAKKTESQIPLKISEESSLSELLQISTKDTIQMTQQPNQETNSSPKKEDLKSEDPKTDEEKDDEDDEEGEEHKKTDSSSDGVIVEASRDMDIKSPQKKHHGILSGVGTKVKNSISKVKKAITGKSSHPKPSSPK